MKQTLLYLLLILLPATGYAQKQDQVWAMSDSLTLDFGFTPPKLSKGAAMEMKEYLPLPAEGCASICDRFGKLLFYSNGKKLWNEKNELMADDLLGGTGSSMQSSIFVQSSDSIVFLFTVDEVENENKNGLVYNKINLKTMQIIEKNKPVFNPAISLQRYKRPGSVGEKLTATLHKNKKDIWIFTHLYFSDKKFLTDNYIMSVLVSQDTVSTQLSLSKTDMIGFEINKFTIPGLLGKLVISPDGTKLATYLSYLGLNTGAYVYDLNNETGLLKLNKFIKNIDGSIGTFAIEFSYKSNYVFFTSQTDKTNNLGVYQYNLNTNEEKLLSLLNTPQATTYVNFKRGNDNNIYVISRYIDKIDFHNRSIDVIENTETDSVIYRKNLYDLSGMKNPVIDFPNRPVVSPYSFPMSQDTLAQQVFTVDSILFFHSFAVCTDSTGKQYFSATPVGGDAPYEFSFGTPNAPQTCGKIDITGYPPGKYKAYITDAKGRRVWRWVTL